MNGKPEQITPMPLMTFGFAQRVAPYCIAGVGYLFALFLVQHTLLSVLWLTGIYGTWLVIYHLGRRRPHLAWSLVLFSFTCASLFIPLSSKNGYWLPNLPIMTACLLMKIKPRVLSLGLVCVLWLSTGLALYFLSHEWDVGGQTVLLISFCSICGCTETINELAAAHRQLQEYSVQLEELSVIRERNRIAREIHDTLGHGLSLLAVQLETAIQLEARGDAQLRTELHEARQVVRSCLLDVRHSVEALRPEVASADILQEQLRRLVEEFETTSPQTRITLDLEEATHALHPDQCQTLYRCVQEALTNIRKHADATKVLVRLSTSSGAENQVELTILDNGQGSVSPSEAGSCGFGLLGMRERVALLSGRLQAGPQADHGWRVEIVFPLKSRRPASASVGSIQAGKEWV